MPIRNLILDGSAAAHSTFHNMGGEGSTLHSIFRAVLNDVWSLKKFNGTGLSGKDNASSCARSYKIYDMHFRVDRGGGGAPPMTSQFRV